ncbi:MAG: non-ribosomal peptide synthetase, partial [Ruminiclostridium sp.]
KMAFEMFEQQVKKTPNKIALVLRENSLTYKELNDKSNQLARRLRANYIKPNDVVGVLVNPTLEMIICILAVIKAGGAYLPLDPQYPTDRISYMLEDCKVRILLTQKHLQDKLHFKGKVFLCENEELYVGDTSNLKKVNTINDLIYVIYTSGSTGRPKGTLIEHKSIINFFEGMTAVIDFNSDKTILSLASLGFDVSNLEMLLPLTQGMRIVIADEQQRNSPKYFDNCIVKNKVDMLQITPSRLQMIINYGKGLNFLKELKDIMIGAEPFPQALLEKLKKLTSAKIYNLYGPTETTVWSTVGELTLSNKVNVGTPIKNTQILIIDNKGELSPVGIEGELCILGDGLARGYLNRPKLTEEKFVQNTFIPGERMYKTGDLARLLPDGNIEVLGRIDNQIKLNGKRIELEEIEYNILKYGSIKEVVVILNENSLCAYIVSDTEIDNADIKKYLLQVLPEYMVPIYFKRINKIPLNFNGKADRKAIQQIPIVIETEGSYIDTNHKASIENTETRLWKILHENVGIKTWADKISLDEPLSNLGIDSVEFVKLIVSAEVEFGIEFEDKYLEYKNLPSLRNMLSYIEARVKIGA